MTETSETTSLRKEANWFRPSRATRLSRGSGFAPLGLRYARPLSPLERLETMTDDTEKPTQELTTQQRAAVGKSARNGVTGKLKHALDLMTWEGVPWNEAALKAGLSTRTMRLALKKSHVLKYLRAERGVLMAQASASTFHRLDELMRQDENRGAAVAAARTIEVMTNEAIGGPRTLGVSGPRSGYIIDLSGDEPTPGLVIQIVNSPARPGPQGDEDEVINVTPNKK